MFFVRWKAEEIVIAKPRKKYTDLQPLVSIVTSTLPHPSMIMSVFILHLVCMITSIISREISLFLIQAKYKIQCTWAAGAAINKTQLEN